VSINFTTQISSYFWNVTRGGSGNLVKNILTQYFVGKFRSFQEIPDKRKGRGQARQPGG